MGAIITSCGTTQETTDDTAQNLIIIDNAQEYIGLPVEEAQTKAAEENRKFRVVELDGQPQPATKDYRPGRINATISDGVVTDVSIEGMDSEKTDTSDDTTQIDPESPMGKFEAAQQEAIDTATELSESYIGLDLQAAEDKSVEDGLEFRVVSQDGESLPATADYRPGRLNATVDDGVITSVEVEQ